MLNIDGCPSKNVKPTQQQDDIKLLKGIMISLKKVNVSNVCVRVTTVKLQSMER